MSKCIISASVILQQIKEVIANEREILNRLDSSISITISCQKLLKLVDDG